MSGNRVPSIWDKEVSGSVRLRRILWDWHTGHSYPPPIPGSLRRALISLPLTLHCPATHTSGRAARCHGPRGKSHRQSPREMRSFSTCPEPGETIGNDPPTVDGPWSENTWCDYFDFPFFGFSHLVLFSPPSRTQTGHTSPRNHCRGITQYHSEWWVANPPNIAPRNPEMGPGTLHGPFRRVSRQDV